MSLLMRTAGSPTENCWSDNSLTIEIISKTRGGIQSQFGPTPGNHLKAAILGKLEDKLTMPG